MKIFISMIHLLTQCFALVILHCALTSSALVAAAESSILKIELRGEKKSLKSLDDAQLICTQAISSKGKGKNFSKTLNKLGLKIQFSSDCETVKVRAENSLAVFTSESKLQGIVLIFPFEIELEGVSSLPMEVVSQKVRIPSHWSSRNLVITSRMGEKPTFINQGSVQVTQLQLGDLLHSLARVQNDLGGFIVAQEVSGVVSEFQNLGRIDSEKTLKLFGRNFQNSSGTLQAKEKMTLNFETFQNQKGSLFGSRITTLHVSGSLDNQEGGIIGSHSATTELDFASTGFASHLGTVHGSEVHLTLNHSNPVELRSGFIQAASSVSVFSPVKVLLPSVSIQTPLLNLSLPDFQIEPLTECSTTVIHCNPKKQFCLTSDFMSQGEMRFLESDYCRTLTQFEKKESEQPESSDLGARVSQALVSLRTQEHHSELLITQKTQELLQKSKEMEVHFQQDQGTHSQYPVGIQSQVIAEQGVHMLLPQGRVILGRDSKGKETGIYTSTLLMRANYFQQASGTVSAEKALLSVPSGMDLGFLEKDKSEKVKVGDQKFPLYRRGNPLLVTHGDCLIRGPLRCAGTLDVGGNLILDSDKRQYSDSPDIHVHGDLIFRGKGDFKLSRDVGTVQFDRESNSDAAHYSEAERFRVDGKIIPQDPKKIELISTRLYADESGPNLSIARQDTVTEKPVQFPGEEAKKDFRTEISTRKQGFLRLEGPKSEGIISTEEVYLLEDEGQFCLVAKNPYFIPPKDPLHLLSLSPQEQRSPKVYHETNLQDSSSFTYEWRERAFFSSDQSREWIESIAEDIVILEKGVGISSFDQVKAIFELSPKLLLSQVQKAVADTLKRSYIDADHTLDLDYLQVLHKNTTWALRAAGIAWSPDSNRSKHSATLGDQIEKLLSEPSLLASAKKPMIFYRAETNQQGNRILKPQLVLPPLLLEKARSRQQGNVFGEVLGSFYAGASVDQILANISEGTPNGDKLRAILTQNQSIIEQINDSARRYEEQLKQTPDFKRQRDDWNIDQKLKGQNISIVRRDNIGINSNQEGGSADFVSLSGDVKILSQKKPSSEQTDPHQEELERRKLQYTGHLNLRAGRNIETQAVAIEAKSGEIEAKGAVVDHTLALHSEDEIQGEGYSKKTQSTQHQTSDFKFKNGFRIKGGKIYLVGSQVEAGKIQLEAKEELQVLGVNDTEQTSESREKETGAWFWKSKKTETHQSSTSTFKAAWTYPEKMDTRLMRPERPQTG